MAITINHTGRKKLDRNQYSISIENHEGGIPTFTFKLNNIDLGIDGNSRVFVEAYYRNTLQRFDFGTLDNPIVPVSTALDKLSGAASPRFRVLIVDFSGDQQDTIGKKGRICAKASGVRGESKDQDSGSSLLVISSVDLGDEIWRVNMEAGDDGRPELCINNKLQNLMHSLKTKPEYQAMILPAAFRQIMTHYYVRGNKDDADDLVEHEWWKLSNDLANEPLGNEERHDSDKFAEWLDEVVGNFCKQHSFCEQLLANEQEAESA